VRGGGVIGALIVVAVLGVGVYVTFINPSRVPDRSESVAWTRACLDAEGGAEEDEALTDEMSGGLGYGDVVGIHWRDKRGAAFFFDSDDDAATAEGELTEFARRLGDDEGEIAELARRHIVRRGAQVLALAGEQTPESRKALGNCVTAIRVNKWAFFEIFETKSVGHPFRDIADPS
jgi:hypothetical protein